MILQTAAITEAHFLSAKYRFKLIDNDTASVFVPENSDAAAIAEEFFSGNFSRKLFRSAAKYCVNIYVNEYKNLLSEGQIIEISDNFAVLINENLYSRGSGEFVCKI